MLKHRPSKAEQRARLQAEVEEFLCKGGKIQQVRMGESGLVDGRYPNGQAFNTHPASQTRTPVPELLAAIDSRRQKNKRIQRPSSARKTVRQKTLYDDFGEPLRKVWVEE